MAGECRACRCRSSRCLNEALYAPRTCHALALFSASLSLGATISQRCRARTCLTLSTVLSQSPQLFDDKKIGVVEKFITDIDLLPQRYHHVRVSLLGMPRPSLRCNEGHVQLLCHCSNAASMDRAASRQCLASRSCALYAAAASVSAPASHNHHNALESPLVRLLLRHWHPPPASTASLQTLRALQASSRC